MHDPARIVKNIGGDVGQTVPLPRPVRHIAREHRHVVIGVRPCIAARAGAMEHDAFEARALPLIQRVPEVDQRRIVESGFGHGLVWRGGTNK